ncbi:MAG: FHA domain-containing protein, partial [Myxococcaceae bacterium]|nr:FHA domain-containing protein [Myxococcaceae bacterium]
RPAAPASEGRTDAAFPPGMRPAARVARPQLTPAQPEPVGIQETTPGSVSTVVPSAPTPAATPVAAPRPSPAPIPATELLKSRPASVSAPPARSSAAPSRFGITVVSGHMPGQRFRLGGAGCMIGRSKGAILFPDDQFVSAHHGTLILRDGRLYIRDEGSLSGVFVSVSVGPEPLVAGASFAAGQRLFRFLGPLPPPPAPIPGRPLTYGAPVPQSQALYALEEVLVGGRSGRTAISGGPLITIGQHHCDLSYPGDETLAARHCELSPNGNTATLRDLSGGLGTWVRIAPGMERPLNPGDRFRVGQQVLQVEAV